MRVPLSSGPANLGAPPPPLPRRRPLSQTVSAIEAKAQARHTPKAMPFNRKGNVDRLKLKKGQVYEHPDDGTLWRWNGKAFERM